MYVLREFSDKGSVVTPLEEGPTYKFAKSEPQDLKLANHQLSPRILNL